MCVYVCVCVCVCVCVREIKTDKKRERERETDRDRKTDQRLCVHNDLGRYIYSSKSRCIIREITG